MVVYAKLPGGFTIPTPVGSYNPDWAIAFQEGKVKHMYFVAETKGTLEEMKLKSIESENRMRRQVLQRPWHKGSAVPRHLQESRDIHRPYEHGKLGEYEKQRLRLHTTVVEQLTGAKCRFVMV